MHLTHPSFQIADQPVGPDGKIIFSLTQNTAYGPSYWTAPALAAYRSFYAALQAGTEAFWPLQLKAGDALLAEFSLSKESVGFDASRKKAIVGGLGAPVGLARMQRRAGLPLSLPPLEAAGLESITLALHDTAGDYLDENRTEGFLVKDVLSVAAPFLSGGALGFVSSFLESSGLALVAGRSLREGAGAEILALPSWEEVLESLCALYALRMRRMASGLRLETEAYWAGEVPAAVIADYVLIQTRYVPGYGQARVTSPPGPLSSRIGGDYAGVFFSEDYSEGGTLELRWPLGTDTEVIRAAMGDAAFDRAWFLVEAEAYGDDYRSVQGSAFSFNPGLAPEAVLMRHAAKLSPGPWRDAGWNVIGEGTGLVFLEEKHFRCRMAPEEAFALQLGNGVAGLGRLAGMAYDGRVGEGVCLIRS